MLVLILRIFLTSLTFFYTFSIFLIIILFLILLYNFLLIFIFLIHTVTITIILFPIFTSTQHNLNITINLITVNKHLTNNLWFGYIIRIFLQSSDLYLTPIFIFIFITIIIVIILILSDLFIQFSNMWVQLLHTPIFINCTHYI